MRICRYANGFVGIMDVPDNHQFGPHEILCSENILHKLRRYVKPAIVDGEIVETATLEEIETYRRQIEFEQDMEFARRKKADGAQYYEEIDARLVALMKGKTDDERNDLDVEYRRKILPYIELVQSGQWWTARRMMNNTTLPKLDAIRALFLEVRQAINNYVTENYPQ